MIPNIMEARRKAKENKEIDKRNKRMRREHFEHYKQLAVNYFYTKYSSVINAYLREGKFYDGCLEFGDVNEYLIGIRFRASQEEVIEIMDTITKKISDDYMKEKYTVSTHRYGNDHSTHLNDISTIQVKF